MVHEDIELIDAPDALRPFVRRIMYANRKLEAALVMRPKPTGYVYFSNHFGAKDFGDRSQDFLTVDGQRFPLASRWHIAGQIVEHEIAVHHFESFEILYCELAATAVHRLFGIPAIRITGRAPPLAEFGEHVEALARKHFVAGVEGTRDKHASEAKQFFTELAEKADPGDPLVEGAVAKLEAANGSIRIGDIADQLGANVRQLNRRFHAIVGMSPKFFGQILQLNWVVGLLYNNQTATLTEIAHEAGFYDQAHFNHTMQRFFSEGPQQFLRSDHVLFKSFLGESRWPKN